jgi:hypothetical protein
MATRERRRAVEEPPPSPEARATMMLAGFVAAVAAAVWVGTRVGVERWKTAAPGQALFDAQLALAAKGASPDFAVAVIAAVIAIGAAEHMRIRFTLYYMAVGGLAVVATAYAMGLDRAGVSADRTILWQVYATAGILGGAVYWLIAGRLACGFGLDGAS